MRKLWPIFMLFSGAIMTHLYYNSGQDLLYTLGLLLILASFTWIALAHLIIPAKNGGFQLSLPSGWPFYTSMVLLAFAAITTYLESQALYICTARDFTCMGLFFFLAVPVGLAALLLLTASFLISPDTPPAKPKPKAKPKKRTTKNRTRS